MRTRCLNAPPSLPNTTCITSSVFCYRRLQYVQTAAIVTHIHTSAVIMPCRPLRQRKRCVLIRQTRYEVEVCGQGPHPGQHRHFIDEREQADVCVHLLLPLLSRTTYSTFRVYSKNRRWINCQFLDTICRNNIEGGINFNSWIQIAEQNRRQDRCQSLDTICRNRAKSRTTHSRGG